MPKETSKKTLGLPALIRLTRLILQYVYNIVSKLDDLDDTVQSVDRGGRQSGAQADTAHPRRS